MIFLKLATHLLSKLLLQSYYKEIIIYSTKANILFLF